MSYTFTNDWFHNSEIKTNINLLTTLLNTKEKLSVLEIGSYEGASTVYFADNLLLHEDSKLIAVDPFLLDDPHTPMKETTEKIFLDNISRSKNSNKIVHRKMMSKNFFSQNNITFDFIYIDGSHNLEDVINDFTNCLQCVKSNSIIWMDDYGADHIGMTKCITELYNKYKNILEVVFLGRWQIGFRVL